MTRQTASRLEPSTTSHVGSQLEQLPTTTAPDTNMARPVRKMTMRMMTIETQVEVMTSSSSVFYLEIRREICFSRIDCLGLTLFIVK